jgi:hypothetical protein
MLWDKVSQGSHWLDNKISIGFSLNPREKGGDSYGFLDTSKLFPLTKKEMDHAFRLMVVLACSIIAAPKI